MYLGAEHINQLRRVAPRPRSSRPFPRTVAAVAAADRADRRLRRPHPRRLRAHADEPRGPAGEATSRSATTSAANFASAHDALDRASSSRSSSSSTCSTSRGARPTPTSSAATSYHNLVASFERVPVAIVYIVANLALGLHLFHGAWSMFQSLGLNNPRSTCWRRYFAIGVRRRSITVGNISVPLAVRSARD